MDSQQLLDELTKDLQRRGLPPAYIDRLTDELADHIEDLIRNRNTPMSKDAHNQRIVLGQIGSCDELATAAAGEFRRRSFFGRHPILTFVVAPIPILMVAWIAFFLVAFAIAAMLPIALGDNYRFNGRSATEWPAALMYTAWSLLFASGVVPPAVAVLLFAGLGRRARIHWSWLVVAGALVAVLAGLFHADLIPPTGPGKGRLAIGFGVGAATLLSQLPQFLLPMLIAAWAALRVRRDSNSPSPGAASELLRAA
ncbi:MAG: hypothetical protein K1X71_02630 [Pirellulales bacterium]|nr:hypothetical protein [Pirellulales bacterium]